MESKNFNNNYPIQTRKRERVRLPAETIQGYIESMSRDKFVTRYEMRKRGYEKMLRVKFKGDVEKLDKFVKENPEHHYFFIKRNWEFAQTMTNKLRFYKRLIERRHKQDAFDERKKITFIQSNDHSKVTIIKRQSVPVAVIKKSNHRKSKRAEIVTKSSKAHPRVS